MFDFVSSIIGNVSAEYEVFFVVTGCLIVLYAVRSVLQLFGLVIKLFGKI